MKSEKFRNITLVSSALLIMCLNVLAVCVIPQVMSNSVITTVSAFCG